MKGKIKGKLNEIKREASENSSVFPRIMMFSNREAIISGCKSITEYDRGEICLDCKKVTVKFSGTDMVIDSYISEEVRISGIIAGMELGC